MKFALKKVVEPFGCESALKQHRRSWVPEKRPTGQFQPTTLYPPQLGARI